MNFLDRIIVIAIFTALLLNMDSIAPAFLGLYLHDAPTAATATPVPPTTYPPLRTVLEGANHERK